MRTVRLAASFLALATCGAGAAQGQLPAGRGSAYPAPYASSAPLTVQPVSDADNLASEIRLLAADPNNVQSLVRAGELALKLDDATAAATFFARAARIDPRNPRIKAGEGRLLVSAERPGEALRHFAEAESLGGDVRSFAADRALAYDLIGEQDRAQRDYRLALRAAENDETRRRYALSLGISGKRELALKEIEPLLRKSDRGAWRSRAFILAMGGDRPGAERIATTMMPAGMAQGLQPFFDLLPTLRPADRAFAVHFGEVRASPTRIADARMVPPLRALGPDPTAPVEVAATTRPVVAAAVTQPSRKDRRSRKQRDRETIVAATTPPVIPLPAPPAYVAQPTTLAATTPYRGQPYAGSARPAASATRAANLAAANAMRSPAATAAFAGTAGTGRTTAPLAAPLTAPSTAVSPVPSTVQTAASPVAASVALGSSVTVAPNRYGSGIASPSTVPSRPPVPLAGAKLTPTQLANTAAGAPPSATSAAMTPAPGAQAAYAASSVAGTPVSPSLASGGAAGTLAAAAAPTTPYAASAPSQPAASLATPMPTPIRSEQSILASIIADISVPGSELVVPERMAITSPPPIQRAIPSRPLAADVGNAARAARPRVAVDAEADAAAKPAAGTKAALRKKAPAKVLPEEDGTDETPVVTTRTRAGKGLADKTSVNAGEKGEKGEKGDRAGKKAADAKKLADAKKAEEKRKNDPKLLEPQRYWVQVAAGANENDLSKQWAKLKTKNAKTLGSRAGYVTPQHATNRILTGPFKTSEEAQAFVNTLARQGVSAFVFASDAGQKVTKLPAK